MRRLLRLLLHLFANGFILMFYSELFFWARYRPGEDRLVGWLFTWLAYSLLTLFFLYVVNRFNVASLPALFLAGAGYGWLAEGLLVQTMYDSFPLQISWTGLAWHALISVCFGWYLIRRGLHQMRTIQLLGLAAGLGAFWGFWAIFWQLETPDLVTNARDFSLFAWAASLLLIGAYWIADRTASPEGFRPPLWMTIPIGILLLTYFLMITVPANPLSLAILPFLLGLIYLAMRKNQAIETKPGFDVSLQGELPVQRYLALLVMPLAASAVYALAINLELVFPTNWIVYVLLTPAGFVLFLLSLFTIFRQQSTV